MVAHLKWKMYSEVIQLGMIIRVVQMRCEAYTSQLHNISILNHPNIYPPAGESRRYAKQEFNQGK